MGLKILNWGLLTLILGVFICKIKISLRLRSILIRGIKILILIMGKIRREV